MNDTTSRHMCVVYDLKVHRAFSLLKWGINVHRGLYTYYFHKCPYVVKLSWPIAFSDWRLSTGTIPAVAVPSSVTPPLTSPDVRIFRQLGPLPKRQQPKLRTNENGGGPQRKSGGGHSAGMRTRHWPWGKGKRGEVKNQALVVEVSRTGKGRMGRRE